MFFLNEEFIKFLLAKYDVITELNISESHLNDLVSQIVAYFSLSAESLQTIVNIDDSFQEFYTSDELLHMNDVLVLFKVMFGVLFVSLTILIATIIYGSKQTKNRRQAGVALMIPPLMIIALLIPVLMAILIDWDQTFTTFHHIFFPNGNWEFDSNSYMLKLLPDGVFFDGALAIGITWILMVLSQFGLGLFLLLKKDKKL